MKYAILIVIFILTGCHAGASSKKMTRSEVAAFDAAVHRAGSDLEKIGIGETTIFHLPDRTFILEKLSEGTNRDGRPCIEFVAQHPSAESQIVCKNKFEKWSPIENRFAKEGESDPQQNNIMGTIVEVLEVLHAAETKRIEERNAAIEEANENHLEGEVWQMKQEINRLNHELNQIR